jgi:protease-3
MSEEQAKTLAQNVRTQLGSKGDEWCRNQDVLVEKNRM